MAYFKAGRSIHPHLLALPVVAPNSFPTFPKCLPVSLNSSVTKGPLPTLVQYALNIPNTSLILFGGIYAIYRERVREIEIISKIPMPASAAMYQKPNIENES